MRVLEQDWNDLIEYRRSLEHYGRKGQKWGEHIFGKERKATGTKRRYSAKLKSIREKRARDRVARAKARAEKRANQERIRSEKKAAAKEKKRRDILNNPTRLYKHRKEFSQEEIEAALKQFEWEKKLSGYSKERLKNGADYINTIFTYTNNAINVYNNAARLIRSVDENSKLPIIKPTTAFDKK